jgi:hypothetical protein
MDGHRWAAKSAQLAAMLDSFGCSGTNRSMPPGREAR